VRSTDTYGGSCTQTGHQCLPDATCAVQGTNRPRPNTRPRLPPAGLLTLQLALTTAIAALCATHMAALVAHPSVLLAALGGSVGILLAFTVSDAARSAHPTNLALLTAFTACEGMLLGVACARCGTVQLEREQDSESTLPVICHIVCNWERA
jgi:uncharacterized YccA/Bax inhibitor family protein